MSFHQQLHSGVFYLTILEMLLEYLWNSYFWKKKSNELFHFGKRKYNIIHCQLRNNASNLMADLYNLFIRYTDVWTLYIDSVEDAHHSFFIITCSKYTILRDVLCQAIQNIIDCDNIFDLDLLPYGSPDHGLNIYSNIWNSTYHIYISYKTLYLNTVMFLTLLIFPHRYYI